MTSTEIWNEINSAPSNTGSFAATERAAELNWNGNKPVVDMGTVIHVR